MLAGWAPDAILSTPPPTSSASFPAETPWLEIITSSVPPEPQHSVPHIRGDWEPWVPGVGHCGVLTSESSPTPASACAVRSRRARQLLAKLNQLTTGRKGLN